MILLTVNGTQHRLDVSPDMRLLWVLRDVLGMTGTKFGCGMSMCGACTVHLDGEAVRSCVMPVSVAAGKKITTIEGLSEESEESEESEKSEDGRHALQKAWIEHQVPQCGYCQTGMIMAAAALLVKKPQPTDADIDEAMTNICRCGTYARIRAAIHTAAKSA